MRSMPHADEVNGRSGLSRRAGDLAPPAAIVLTTRQARKGLMDALARVAKSGRG